MPIHKTNMQTAFEEHQEGARQMHFIFSDDEPFPGVSYQDFTAGYLAAKQITERETAETVLKQAIALTVAAGNDAHEELQHGQATPGFCARKLLGEKKMAVALQSKLNRLLKELTDESKKPTQETLQPK